MYWQGLGKHLVDYAPLRCSKNLVDARDKKYRQRAESLSLAGASLRFGYAVVLQLQVRCTATGYYITNIDTFSVMYRA